MASDLKQKAISGMIWTAIQKYSVYIIQFISGIVLARLLTPYDFGCIGMLSIFMCLAQSFIDSGFGSALIQKKQPTEQDYSSIFWWNIVMAIVMYAIVYVSAPFIASFYNIPILSRVLRVQGIVLIIYAFNIIQQNQLRKKLNFRLLSVVSIISSVTALSVTVWMARSGFGVWSLVVQNILTTSIPAVVFWIKVKWKPKFLFSKSSFKELFSFGFYMFMTDLLNTLGKQIQGLLIGRFYNPTIMGYYSNAKRSEELACSSVSQVITQVTYPLYSEVQDDKVRLSNMIKRLTTTLAYLSFPMMFILLLCAKPLFIVLYSDKWLPSASYFQILCIAGLALCLQSVNTQAIAAIGKSRVMFKWTVVKRIVNVALVVMGVVLGGVKGLLYGIVIDTWFSYFVNIGLVAKYIGYRVGDQIRHLFPILLVSVIATGISYITGYLLDMTMYVDAAVKVSIFLLIYIGWSLVFKPDSFLYFKGTVMPMVKNFGKKICIFTKTR